MKLYLAGVSIGFHPLKHFLHEFQRPDSTIPRPIYSLESFESIHKDFIKYTKSKYCKGFLLDSGAFTFLKKSANIDWDIYLDKYINFINEFKIDLFFELDIDAIVGISKVEQFRQILEDGTGKQCIPVWHKSRGKDYFIKLCQKYDYVAVGGLAIKVITKDDYKYLPWFVKTAHQNGTKIHCLGFCPKDVEKYNFDSFDVSSWASCMQYGGGYDIFNGHGMTRKRVDGRRAAPYVDFATHQLSEWVKYQHHLDTL